MKIENLEKINQLAAELRNCEAVVSEGLSGKAAAMSINLRDHAGRLLVTANWSDASLIDAIITNIRLHIVNLSSQLDELGVEF